jgi:hypothetical protein
VAKLSGQSYVSTLSARSISVRVQAAPAAVGITSWGSTGAGQMTVAWSCDLTCSGGVPISKATYGFSVATGTQTTPEIPAVTALGGDRFQAAFNGLTTNTSYSVTITVTNVIGPGPPTISTAAETDGPPTVTISASSALNDTPSGDTGGSTGTAADDAGPQTTVTVSMTAGGSPISGCTFNLGGGSPVPGQSVPSCPAPAGFNGTFNMQFATWNIPYAISITVTTSISTDSTTQTAQFDGGDKNLTVDAAPYFPPGTGKYSGGNAHSFNTPNFNAATSGFPLWTEGTEVQAACYTPGGQDSGTNSPSTKSSTWIEMTNNTTDPYMNTIYFSDVVSGQPGAANALPHC